MLFWMSLTDCVDGGTDEDGVVEQGMLFACLESADGEVLDAKVVMEAIVGAPADPGPACGAARNLQLVDGDGTSWVLGFEVKDADGVDITPVLDVAPGDEVSLHFRNNVVWGDVSGFVLEDFEGALIVAADEGSWGGALKPGEVDGVVIERGREVIATEPSSCQPIEGFNIVFSADEKTVLAPVQSRIVHLGGQPFTGMAVAAWDYGEPDGCSIADATGFTSWALVR